jgi:hypothetical protein
VDCAPVESVVWGGAAVVVVVAVVGVAAAVVLVATGPVSRAEPGTGARREFEVVVVEEAGTAAPSA